MIKKTYQIYLIEKIHIPNPPIIFIIFTYFIIINGNSVCSLSDATYVYNYLHTNCLNTMGI